MSNGILQMQSLFLWWHSFLLSILKQDGTLEKTVWNLRQWAKKIHNSASSDTLMKWARDAPGCQVMEGKGQNCLESSPNCYHSLLSHCLQWVNTQCGDVTALLRRLPQGCSPPLSKHNSGASQSVACWSNSPESRRILEYQQALYRSSIRETWKHTI